MNDLPSLRQLRYLAALAENRHFGRAAEACHVSQSTLSAGIQELEQRLGGALVERTKRNVRLTPLGEQVAERARALLADAEALVALGRAAEPLGGPLRLGVIPTISPYLLPRLLPALRRKHAKLRLYLTEDLTARIVERLNEGNLDLLLLALPYDLPGLETMTLFDDPFLFAARRGHPLAQGDEAPLPPARLEHEPLLLLEDGHCLRDQALAACRLGERRRQPFAATSLPTLIQMVDNGIGSTLLPRMAVASGALKGTAIATRPLAPESGQDQPSRSIGLAWRRSDPRRPAFRQLGQEITELARRYELAGETRKA
jgi:LysR family hydrogen peroxide-inducible transcriptional activator